MSWVLFVALLQAPAQVNPLERHIEAFLKGDQEARSELLKLGVPSIRPLLKARVGYSSRIDALLFEIKAAAAYPATVVLPGRFDEREGMMRNEQWSAPYLLVTEFKSRGIPLFTDQFDKARLKPVRMALFNPGTRLQLIELFCQDTALDYGFFHNTVVIGLPERLWPDQGPAKTSKLDEAAVARARQLVEKLGDPSIETRESASRELLALGTGVIDVLKAQLKREDRELVTRCEAMLRRLIQTGCPFGPAACLRQKLTGDDEAVLRLLQREAPRLAVNIDDVAHILKELSAAHGLKFESALDLTVPESTIHTSGQSLLDVISLITQSHDMDFLILDGKVVIDSRLAIEVRLK